MPICIAGMHRSGTSMVARMMYVLGLYLGHENNLMPPQPDNPEGFWEHLQFVRLNDELLSFLGGGWDCPPPLPQGWGAHPGLAPFSERATALCNEFKDHAPWGWKDPRNSLTFEFWRRILPDVKVVVCVRNPEEVAQSLSRRGDSSLAFGYKLWSDYNRTLMSSLQPGRYLVTLFESYFNDPRPELERLSAFAGIPVTAEKLGLAAATVKPALRRNRASLAGLPLDVARFYERLRAEAGATATG